MIECTVLHFWRGQCRKLAHVASYMQEQAGAMILA